jgi:hypothetical protein
MIVRIPMECGRKAAALPAPSMQPLSKQEIIRIDIAS